VTRGRRPAGLAEPLPEIDLSSWRLARERPLRGRVAAVAGGTRGAGRAISVCLALAGAKVYVSGRSRPGRPATPGRPETIDGTVELIRRSGGAAVPVRVDHTDEEEVRALFRQIARENHGRLDVLVNDVWGGEELTEWGVPAWKLSWAKGRQLLERAVASHLITARHGVPLMVKRRRGLLVEVTDGAHALYRGSLFYDLVKSGVIRIAYDYAEEFREAKLPRVAAVAVTPGFLRSEFMLEQFGVTEENWRDAASPETSWAASETPYFLGQGVAHLAADPRVARRSGAVVGSWQLAREYGFRDRDGRRPDWGKEWRRKMRAAG
jgi:NAD(P)-dependent dehydrogenase (short-subunit alcohol dehydrogenase family)